MQFELLIRSLAEKDIKKTIDWYNFQQKNLGDIFLQEVANSIKIVLQNPFLFQIRYKEIRIAYLKKFPYGIHYCIQKNKIIVLGVFHFKMHTENWMKRK